MDTIATLDDNLFYGVYGFPSFHLPKPKKGIMYLGTFPKQCRFCLRDATTTKFSKKAHLFPHATGNQIFFTHFECDQCNELFGTYESSFSNFGSIFNTLSMIQGKRGVSGHSEKNDELKIVEVNGKLEIRSKSKSFDKPISERAMYHDKEKQTLTFNTTRPDYIPQHVYKVLCKMAFCLLPEDELQHYEETRRWLIGELTVDSEPKNGLFVACRRIVERRFEPPEAFLYKN